MERPQSTLGDFYREFGDLFGLPLAPSNRYGGFKVNAAGLAAHAKGDSAGAIASYEQALVASPAAVAPRYNLACEHARVDEADRAFALVEDVLRIGSQEALRYQGRVAV